MNRNPEIESRLDLSCYKGEDLYTDGDIEDRLLEIVRTYSKKEYNQLIAEEKNWPVLYHLSNLRDNVLSWYPFRDTDEVLEIGAGCGAVTGAFAGKVKSVTCVDLSKKRCLINAYKNSEFSNLKILVGNFEDVEKKSIGQYDVITLIGVLEYARYYIHEEDPFRSFLQKIEKHLKPGGKIIIAIENRLGLKYWAGYSEDHVLGGWYEGVEGYPHRNGPQTFSRKELLRLIGSAGDFETELYYPHPDYKFPCAVFSDRRLPKLGELKANRKRNFDQKRIVSFNEDIAFDSLIENGLYPDFANSLMAVIKRKQEVITEEDLREGKEQQCPVECVKYSNERSQEFAVMTKIVRGTDGQPAVIKQACDKQGISWISHIEESGKRLKKQFSGTDYDVNRCEQVSEDAVRLEFIRSGRTFADELNDLLRNNKRDKLIRSVQDYVRTLKTVCRKKRFVPSDEFRKVFGEYRQKERVEDVFEEVCDIDLTFDNLLLTERGKTIIDYEWTFDFDIPLKYVAWRAVYLFFGSRGTAAYDTFAAEINASLGITASDWDQYYSMEKCFQRYVMGNHTSLDELYETISPGYIDAGRVIRIDAPEVRSEGVPHEGIQAEHFMDRIDELENMIERKNEQIDMIYRSTSWKITRPLRFILDKIRGMEYKG